MSREVSTLVESLPALVNSNLARLLVETPTSNDLAILGRNRVQVEIIHMCRLRGLVNIESIVP